MTLLNFSATDFRCLEAVSLEPDPRYNLIFGSNASGKTSLLEAIGYLGRGRSFRRAPVDQLIRHGMTEFILFGKAGDNDRQTSLGVRNGREGLEISIGGRRDLGAAALPEVLPLQIVDPEVHDLVAGGPEERRRYVDWLAFHVEPNYLSDWRLFRRALRQRNSALRDGADRETLSSWDRELAEVAERVHAGRVNALEKARDALRETGERLLGGGVRFDYQRGWPEDRSLLEALQAGQGRDRQMGSTQVGPQRADLRLSREQRGVRKVISRGQQKLLACTLILAATAVVQRYLQRRLLLLLDDPAAELDPLSLGRLMEEVAGLACQVIATSLESDRRLFHEPPRLFHVEQGRLRVVE